MKCLIVSTLPKQNKEVEDTIQSLTDSNLEIHTVYTETMNIHGCVGCNFCWLKTPGICSIKDDYEKLLIQYLQTDIILFITEAKLGFISYKCKNLIDRILPLCTMNLCVVDGQIRHTARYNKTGSIGMVYAGQGDKSYLNQWLEMVCKNLHYEPIGAFSMSDRKEIAYALNHN